LRPREIKHPRCAIVEESDGTDTGANGRSGGEEYEPRRYDECV